MTKIRLVHTIHTDASGFWKMFFDPALNQALYRKALKFPQLDVLAFEETDTRITRRMAVTPNLSAVPGPVAKLLGSNFGYVEDGVMTKGEGVFRFTTTPNVLADKITMTGNIYLERGAGPLGQGGDAAVQRVVEVSVEARIFAVGGMFESATEKTLRDSWGTSTTYMNEYIEGKHRDLV